MSTQTIQPDATAGIDAVANHALPTTNNGTSASFGISGKGSTDPSYAHIKFDLTARAASDLCTAATLTLYVNATGTTTRTYEVWALVASNSGWTEAGMNWNTKDGSVAWTGGANGGGVEGTDLGAAAIGTQSYTANDPVGTPLAFVLDTATVKAAFGGTLCLVVKRQGTTTSTSPSFRSSDSATTAERPKLVIDYTVASPAVAGVASSRATDAVAFPQCTYTGDTDNDEVITVKRKVQGTNDSTYVTLGTYYDRTNKIAYAGHSVDFGAGAVVHRGDINLTPGATYTYQFTFSGGGTTQTVDQAMLARLDPMARTRPARKPATAWFWNGSDTVAASVVRENAIIIMTKGEETSVSPSSLASMTSVRNGATDMPIYQYFSIEIRRDLTDGTYNLTWRRNSIIFDASLETDFQNSFSEDWFIHNGGNAMVDRIYNTAYSTLAINPTKPGLLSWVYKAFLQNLFDRHTDATAAAVRFQGVAIDNMQHNMDGNWRTTATVNPVTPIETAYDSKAEIMAAWRAMYAYLKATGTYLLSNIVNATTQDQLDDATLLDGEFIESTVTTYSGASGITYRTGTDWKAHVDTLLTIRDTVNGPDHLVAVIQIGTAPHNDDDVNYCLWSYAMFMDGYGAGKKVVFRPADNADYDEDEVSSSGTLVAGSPQNNAPEYLRDWGTPSATQYVQDTSVGAGDERVYKRVFANGTVWFNPTAGSLSPTSGPTLAARTGQYVPTGAFTQHDRHMPRGVQRGQLRGVAS